MLKRTSIDFPSFDGQIRDDEASLAAAARSFGHHAAATPVAVLAPGSVDDVVKLVRFARSRRLPVAARGQGHATMTQALVEGGIVVDMATLGAVREVSKESVVAEGGARWASILDHTIPRGLTPPTLTDYQGLSVGGTLSVGGIGGESHRHGAQVDNVLELDVVTGEGELVRCSSDRDAELFDACRGGLGQFGIIVAARVRLVPAPPRVRSFVVKYDGLEAFVQDQVRLAGEASFDHLYGNISALEGGAWDYELVATRYLWDDRRPAEPDPPAFAGQVTPRDASYAAFTRRVDDWVAMLIRTGTWELPHPWLDLFLRASDAVSFISSELARSTPEALGGGGILLYPLRRSRCSAPFLRLPDEEDVLLFDVLRNATPPTPRHVQALVDENARAYREALTRDAKLYAIGSTPMRRADWETHFGAAWPRFEAAKRRFDPDQILAPGQGLAAQGAPP
jgi:cytokinin dehydrogenase